MKLKTRDVIRNVASNISKKMSPMFGFTIGGLMMLCVVIVAAFSAIGSFGSFDSEESITEEVVSTLDFDNPDICFNFDDPQMCISNVAYMKRDPGMCVSLLEDEKDQYDCLSKFFRKYQERACDYVSEKYYADCITEVEFWKQN